MDQNVRRQWNHPARDVGSRNGYRAVERAPRIRTFKPELKSHHEIYPIAWPFAQGLYYWRGLAFGKPVRTKDRGDLSHFFFGNRNDLLLFALSLAFVMLSIALCRKVAAEAHRDRSGSDFGEARGY